ncbi:MAG: CoA-binding protein [Methanocellales archaeon]
MSLDSMFLANSIAIVGASRDPKKLGYTILKNILDGGFRGKIYPVNPKLDEILGLKAYPSLLNIEGEIDLVVIIVPAKAVPQVMEDAGRKGVKCAIVISGGFREIGIEGEALEKQVLEVARKYGIRVLGPNCQGVNYTYNNLCASWPLLAKKGAIAIISQSGTVGAAFEGWAVEEGIGFSAFVSLGNKADIDEVDLIDFFSRDGNTRVIALYIEGVRDGRRFLEAAKKSSKPIVVLKPGKTERAKVAIQSHTKAVAGRDEVFNAACKKAGVKRVDSLIELYDFSKALAYLNKLRGKNVLIVTSSGGSGILATDLLESIGFKVIEPSSDFKARLRSMLPTHCIVDNPVDLTGDANAEMYEKVLEIAIEEPAIDALLVIFGDPIAGACEVIDRIRRKNDKPVVVCYLGGGEIEKIESREMHSRGIPVFPTPERAVSALKALG